AIGQGALAIETRADDADVREALQTLDHAPSHQAARAERAFLKTLGGSCQTPIAGYALVSGNRLTLRGLVVGPSGHPYLLGTEEGPVKDPEGMGQYLAHSLLARGADKILN